MGGKALHLAGLLPDVERIDAADSSQRKLDLLADGVRRLGSEHIRAILTDLTAADASIEREYDGILLDAPCTGLGVLRRHPEAKWRDDGTSIAKLADVQRRLLDAVAPRVRPGGVLVYSVCTFAAAEGSEQIEAFLHRHPHMELAQPPPDDEVEWSTIIDSHGHLRTWPHRHNADAFFAARMIRRA